MRSRLPWLAFFIALAPGAQVRASGAGERPASGAARAEVPDNGPRYHLDFTDLEIAEVIRYIALWTGKNIVVPPDLHQRLTLLSPTPVTGAEAWDAFLAALHAGGLWLDQQRNSYRVRAVGDGPAPLCGGTGRCSGAGNEAQVTRLLRVRFVAADEMKNALQQAVASRSTFVVSPPDALIVTDTALEVDRIESLVRSLDQPGARLEIHVVQLRHARARELVTTLLQVFPPSAAGRPPGGARLLRVVGADAQPANGGPSVVDRIVADERSNQIIIVADAPSFARVVQVIEQLDVE